MQNIPNPDVNSPDTSSTNRNNTDVEPSRSDKSDEAIPVLGFQRGLQLLGVDALGALDDQSRVGGYHVCRPLLAKEHPRIVYSNPTITIGRDRSRASRASVMVSGLNWSR